jgi:hypothetical protein
MKYSAVIIASLALSVSCSKVQKVEKNMDNMMQKTEQMSTTTGDMKETTTIMYQQIRSKEAEDTRNKKFIILKSEEEKIGEKIAAAAVYFKSFEFQLWSAQEGFDNNEIREKLILDAVNEFTKRISDLYEKINVKKMIPTNDGKKHSSEQAFYALAATMHMNHSYQEELVDQKAGIKAISFYDIIKGALDKESSGEALTEYEEVLVSGVNKEMMIELIKARVDMMAALGLKNLTDKRDMTLGQKVKAAIFKVSGGKLGSIDLPETFSTSNGPTKKQTIKYLDAANKAKKFLLNIDVEKQLEKTLKSAFSKIDLGESAGETSDSELAGKVPENEDKIRIRNLINNLLN